MVENFAVRSETKELCIGEDRGEYYQQACQELLLNMENLQARGSGWTISRINYLQMNQTICNSPSGSAYIELPEWVKNKKAVVNIKNNDNKCFMWSVLAHLHPADRHAERVAKYEKYKNELKFDKLEFPMKIKDIDKFEKMNDLVVNVFECTQNGIINRLRPSRRISSDISENKVINLLYHQNDLGNSHYSLIKNLNKLINKRGEHQKMFCIRCHHYYNNWKSYNNHIEDCGRNKPVEHKLSKKESIKFENISKTQKHRFVIYADFESIIKNYSTQFNNPNGSWTSDVGKHIASGFCVVVVDSYTVPVTYQSKFCCEYFRILRFLFICNLFSGYDHCTDCPNLVEDANSDLKGFLYNANSAVRRLCRLGPGKEKCILATKTANEILQTLVDEMFPREPTEESNLLTCSHLLFLCPDKDSKGKEIESGAWSCSSCELFLHHLFTILNTPLPKVNNAMTSILCPTKDADCLNVFTDVFQISGILGEFIQNKRTAPAVCKVLKCIN